MKPTFQHDCERCVSFIAGLLIGAMIGAVTFGTVLDELGRSPQAMQKSAIEAGVAEWRIDAKTGVRELHWNTTATAQPEKE